MTSVSGFSMALQSLLPYLVIKIITSTMFIRKRKKNLKEKVQLTVFKAF